MPYTVDDLISEHQRLIYVQGNATAKAALDLMTEHDFSQLPVVDTDMKLLGMVTSDSILRALKNFVTTIDGLKVSHALVVVKKHYRTDDLFDLLAELRDGYAMPIVDTDNRVEGIVTSYDTTEFFQRRAQDMMSVEDIEKAVKEFISSTYRDAQGVPDPVMRDAAVKQIMNTDAKARKAFIGALQNYLGTAANSPIGLDAKAANVVYDNHFVKGNSDKGFDDYTFADYISLLMHDNSWLKVSNIFDLDKKAVFSLLDDVRQTRNALFHFRGEILPSQRDQLEFCADWLNRLRDKSSAAITANGTKVQTMNLHDFIHNRYFLANPASSVVVPSHNTAINDTADDATIVPVEDEGAGESRYAALASYLQMVPIEDVNVMLSFADVEDIISDDLPANARQHRSWWANDSVSHVQSQQWIDAGWRVNNVNIAGEVVVFTRNLERERLYIEFFSPLIAELKKNEAFPVRAVSSGGKNWQTIAVVPRNGRQQAIFALSFATKKRFRAELYIDTGNKGLNKQLFDHLAACRQEIETIVGESLSWERLDNRRASRIALYREGTIGGKEKVLDDLRQWAVAAMPRMYAALADRAESLLEHLNKEKDWHDKDR